MKRLRIEKVTCDSLYRHWFPHSRSTLHFSTTRVKQRWSDELEILTFARINLLANTLKPPERSGYLFTSSTWPCKVKRGGGIVNGSYLTPRLIEQTFTGGCQEKFSARRDKSTGFRGGRLRRTMSINYNACFDNLPFSKVHNFKQMFVFWVSLSREIKQFSFLLSQLTLICCADVVSSRNCDGVCLLGSPQICAQN